MAEHVARGIWGAPQPPPMRQAARHGAAGGRSSVKRSGLHCAQRIACDRRYCGCLRLAASVCTRRIHTASGRLVGGCGSRAAVQRDRRRIDSISGKVRGAWAARKQRLPHAECAELPRAQLQPPDPAVSLVCQVPLCAAMQRQSARALTWLARWPSLRPCRLSAADRRHPIAP